MVIRYVIAAAALVAVSTTAVRGGGWTVITLKNVPAHAWAGGGHSVIYTVRQHGHTPMNGLAGRVEARKGATVLRSASRELRSTGGVRSEGAYVVDVPFPEPGTWTVALTAGSGLVGDTLTMTMRVLPPGAAEPAVAAVERGRRLFEGKGCVMCHRHPEFGDRPSVNLLDLSATHHTAGHVRAFLSSFPRTPAAEPFGTMPDLGLAPHEVEALAAFLGR